MLKSLRVRSVFMECDYCAYNAYDEDDMARFMSHKYKKCPYFKNGDEYRVVRHQM